MTATTMRFGPEWMRKQPAPTKPHATSSPPPSNGNNGHTNGTPAPPGASSYSALVTPHVPSVPGKRDIAHPFKYSRDEMLQFYKDGGGYSELPIEVERWEGIVREPAGEPACLHDLTEAERKIFTTSINSEIRRRQSTDYMAQGDRSKGGTLNTGLGLMGRRRRGDSNGTDHPPLSLPRKTSWSGAPGSLISPALASPRTRMGSGSGFDGILNGSNDTAWGGGKRRVPSGQPFSGRVDEEEEAQRDSGEPDIKNVYASEQKPEVSDQEHTRKPDPVSSSGLHQDSGDGIKDTTASMNNLTLNTNLGAPPGELSNVGGQNNMEAADLGKLLWSYIDPLGNVQGPFPGETMQLWHTQNYFTDNLLMKRTTIDAEFYPLSEIKRRAQGDRIFLSPLSDNVPPPGLGPMSAGPRLNSILHRTGVLDAPHQPSPQGYGRSNVLDYINAGSTATGSASPSSSFGGTLARGPVTPDPAIVGSRLQRLASDNPMNGRTSAAGSYSSHSSPAMPQAVRHAFNEPVPANRGSLLDAQSNIPWQMPQANGFQGWNGSQDMSQLGQPGRIEPIIASPVGHSPFARDSSPYMMSTGQHPVDPFLSPSAHQHRFFEQQEQIDINARRQDFHGSGFQHVPNEAPLRFVGAPQQLSMPQSSIGQNRGFEQPISSATASPTVERAQQQYQNRQASPLSPWGIPQAQEPPRPRPFDSDQPTSSNTFIVPPQKSAWDRPQVETRPPVAHDPWAPGPQANTQEGQGQMTEEPQGSASLTMANVIQHNEQQARSTNVPVANDLATSVDVTVDTADTAPPTISPSSIIPTSPRKESAAQPPVPKRKTSHAIPAAPTLEKPQSSAAAAKPSATTPVTQKAAWATDDDVKAKPTHAPMNLREIQEVEKKKQEARRATDKERERAARAAAIASSTDEVQFTASWGLPTSQVGSRGVAPASKDTPALSPATTSAPVWTSAAKPAAKTMKEIQEEEERRKQQAVKAETIASAAKRAVQTPAAKGPLATAQATGGAWTVVGTGGKGPVPASVVAARPAPITQTSTSSTVPSRPAAVTSNSRPVSSPIVTKVVSSTAKVEDEPSAPSLEFLKWMRDNLKGLNSSVQFEEFAQMLLSFPLDPDQPTKELIADAVYAASTTLDGRRFAKEFVEKRKQDARSRPRAQGQASNGKGSSLADVVKAQPKPAQNEFGGYKVVKKKNKRG